MAFASGGHSSCPGPWAWSVRALGLDGCGCERLHAKLALSAPGAAFSSSGWVGNHIPGLSACGREGQGVDSRLSQHCYHRTTALISPYLISSANKSLESAQFSLHVGSVCLLWWLCSLWNQLSFPYMSAFSLFCLLFMYTCAVCEILQFPDRGSQNLCPLRLKAISRNPLDCQAGPLAHILYQHLKHTQHRLTSVTDSSQGLRPSGSSGTFSAPGGKPSPAAVMPMHPLPITCIVFSGTFH